MATKTTTTAKATAKVDPKKAKKEIAGLIAELKVAAEKKDRKGGKRIRRKLRALGHRGGLRQNA